MPNPGLIAAELTEEETDRLCGGVGLHLTPGGYMNPLESPAASMVYDFKASEVELPQVKLDSAEKKRIRDAAYYETNKARILARQTAYYKANPKKMSARRARTSATYRKLHPQRVRAKKLRETHSLTLERWDAMLIAQCGRCGICSKPMTGSHEPCVDHDHKTGKVRELLCHHCNVALGLLKEDSVIIRELLAYIERHHA